MANETRKFSLFASSYTPEITLYYIIKYSIPSTFISYLPIIGSYVIIQFSLPLSSVALLNS